jgi:hypothetical protein
LTYRGEAARQVWNRSTVCVEDYDSSFSIRNARLATSSPEITLDPSLGTNVEETWSVIKEKAVVDARIGGLELL